MVEVPTHEPCIFLMVMELDAYYKAIYEYKKNRRYLPGCPDNYKRVLRKSAISYTLIDDKLYYTTDGELRYVPMTWKERLYYLASAHMGEGKHISKNTMAQWMTDKKVVWKGISVDCTAFASACIYCGLGERKMEPVKKQVIKDDPVLKMAEDNYSLLLNYLQKQTFPSTTPLPQRDAVTSIARQFMIQKGVLYYKKGKMGELRCLEVGTKDRKVAMQAAHVVNDEHFGPEDTLLRLSEKYIWNRMTESVNSFVSGCCKKLDEEPGTPKTLINRNVDFFHKQFLKGVVDEVLLDGKEKYALPVNQNIKDEPKSPEQEEESGGTEEGDGDGETQVKNSNQNASNKQSLMKEGEPSTDTGSTSNSKKPSASSSPSPSKDRGIKTELLSDRVTRTAVRSILPAGEVVTEEDMDESVQGASPNSTESAGQQAPNTDDIPPSDDSQENGARQGDKNGEKKKKVVNLKCEFCGMIFKGYNKYKTHMYGHTGVKPYPCTLCDKSFTLKKTLKFHLGKHAGQKPFLCNICGKRFHVPNSLRSHLQIHAKGGNNIHYCKLCNREFATDARFEKHLKFKHPAEEEEHLCSQCGKKFCSRKSLKRHEKSAHDALKTHFCKVCERGFFRKEYLNRHMQQHGQQPDGESKKRPLAIRKPKALQKKIKSETKEIAKPSPGNIIIQTVQEDENTGLSNVVGNIRIEVEPGQVEEYFIQEGESGTENMYYAVETSEVEQEGAGSTLVYSFPSVQYEIECPDGQLNSEALSAITMLAQASSQQNV